MSRHAVLPEEGIGPGGDIVFRKLQPEDNIFYRLFVGDTLFGLVCKGRSYWSAISYNPEPSEFFRVNFMEGFATRFKAASFIIKHRGYWMQQERDHWNL